MIRKFFYALCIFLSFFKINAYPNIRPEACHFGLQAELLYLAPSTDANPFALETVTSTTLKSLLNSPGYNPGFRLEGVYAWDCKNTFHTRFTYFNSGSNKRSVTSTFLSPPPTFTGTVTDDVKYRYYAVELLFGRWFFGDCDFDFELEAGIIYSNIKFDEFITAVAPTGTSSSFTHSKFSGVGPEIAVNLRYPFFCDLAVAFDARGALLLSEIKSANFGVGGFNLISDPFYGINPASDIRLGLNWRSCWGCLNYNVEAGYEWIYYHRAFIQASTPDNITFDGPYFALGIDY